MNTPVEVQVDAAEVAAGAVELVADALFTAGASAVAEHPGPDGSVVLVADPDPEHLAASGLEWRPHRPEHPSAGADTHVVQVRGRELMIDADGAFGHGAHPSTRGCLQLMEQVIRSGSRVLDVGSGSGVLSVAAAALGAVEVVAIDIDPDAVEATRRTVGLNGFTDVVHVAGTPLAAVEGTFDVVVANLLIPVVEELGALIAARVRAGGHAVLSGVLDIQADRATAALAPLEVLERITLPAQDPTPPPGPADPVRPAWAAMVLCREGA